MTRNFVQGREMHTRDRERLFLKRTSDALHLSNIELRRVLSSERLAAVRINTLSRRTTDDILADLRALPVRLTPIAWAPHAFFVDDKHTLTQSELFQNGDIYVQTASSLIPALAMQPLGGDKIADLCAAPGGKACHIASLVDGKAELWVNDSNKLRIKKLKEVLAWQHVQPYEVTAYSAQYADKFMEHGYYDKILLDAQCSGEGRIDLSSPVGGLQYWSIQRVHDYSRLQQRMLRSAYKLLKPGGLLVYSTCTIAPDENEVPVSFLVKHTDALIEPFTLPIPEARPGLTVWDGNKLEPSLSGALRIRPSLEMEAFFVCCIRKPE